MNSSWRNGKRVAIVGAGPGGISSALAFIKQGFDVKVFERYQEPKALGGGVLLSVPVLAVLRHYGINIEHFGMQTTVKFKNNHGKVRADLPFNQNVEKAFNIKGWHYGVLRSNALSKMLEQLPKSIIEAGKAFSHYEQNDQNVTLYFEKGEPVEADLLIGADGIHSKVSKQTFGDPRIFHVGLRAWLAWCGPISGVSPDSGVISHSHKYQASYFPMLHNGKPGFEWWIVEPQKESSPFPDDVEGHIRHILKDFADPMPRFLEATDLKNNMFSWDVYNRPSLQTWSDKRVVCIGDAAHPVSPYAAYGMGMAIEDGYFLAKHLAQQDFSDIKNVSSGLQAFEAMRVNYVNHNVEFARKLGNIFHQTPYPLAKIRDFIYNHTSLLDSMIKKDYLGEQESMCLSMKELHQNN